MRYFRRSDCSWLILILLAALGLDAARAGEPVRLRYVGRYDCQSGMPDHLMGVEQVLDHHALVSSNMGLTLVDLTALPVGGTESYVDRLSGVNCVTTETRADGYGYASLLRGGITVFHLNAGSLQLTEVRDISEPDVFFERLSVVGDRLYVTAHAYGIRIYDISDPSLPTLVGSLTSGFDDAIGIAVLGDTAYVGDGAGGLKIVDIADEAQPQIIAGEDPESAAGTADDVMIIGDHVYVASGGSGVAVYDLGDISSRALYDTPVCARQLARIGDYLAAADTGGLQVFAIEPDGSLTPAASELAMRRSRGGSGFTTRLWHGVSAWGHDYVLAANWCSMDIYQLVDPELDDQADLTATTQRLRFPPQGGVEVVQITNDGSGPLEMTNIYSSAATFTVEPGSAALAPGESLDLTVTYAGGSPGSAMIRIDSNDPDEDPLPIQVFGATQHLDPGEPAIPFTLEAWTYNHDTQEFEHSPFDLAAQAGRIVYFHVYATW